MKNENSPDIIESCMESTSTQTVSGEGIYYKSGQVAQLLGITPDSLRYYSNTFSEFLNFAKTKQEKGGHLRFTDDDIAMLQTIFTLLKKHSPAETKAILRSPEGVHYILSDPDAPGAKELQEQLVSADYIINRVTKSLGELFSKGLAEQAALFQNNYALEDQQRNEEMNLLKEEINLLNEQNALLKKNIEQANEQIAALEEKKKSGKGLFGFLKK